MLNSLKLAARTQKMDGLGDDPFIFCSGSAYFQLPNLSVREGDPNNVLFYNNKSLNIPDTIYAWYNDIMI